MSANKFILIGLYTCFYWVYEICRLIGYGGVRLSLPWHILVNTARKMSLKQRKVVTSSKIWNCMETNDLLQLWTFSNCLYEPITVIIVDRVYFIAETRHLNRTAGVRPACVFKVHGCPRLHSLSFWAGHWWQLECGRDFFNGSMVIQERAVITRRCKRRLESALHV
jgi:hypothetical protein